MHRNIIERSFGSSGPEKMLRRHPDYYNIALTSKGRLIAEIPNMLAVPEDVGADLVKRNIIIARRAQGATVTAPEKEFGALMDFVRANDDLIIQTIAKGETPPEGWDTESKYAATLTRNVVAVHIPKGVPETDKAITTEFGRVVLVKHAKAEGVIESVERYMEIVPVDPETRQKHREAMREHRWVNEQIAAREQPFITAVGNHFLMTLRNEHEKMIQPLLDNGAKEIKYGIIQIHRHDFLNANLSIAAIAAEYEQISAHEEAIKTRPEDTKDAFTAESAEFSL